MPCAPISRKKGKSGHVDEEYYQVLLLGMGGVGKSSLVLQLVFSEFEAEYKPSEVDNYQAQLEVDGTAARLDILDTSGQEEYAIARDSYIRNSAGFLVVFSIAEQESFDAVTNMVDSIRRVKMGEDVPIFIVGNKVDLQKKRVVWSSSGEDLALKNNLTYHETSAKTAVNVKTVFIDLVKHMRALKTARQEEAQGDESSRRRKTRCVIM